MIRQSSSHASRLGLEDAHLPLRCSFGSFVAATAPAAYDAKSNKQGPNVPLKLRVAAVAAIAMAAHADGQTFSIDAKVVGTGTSVRSGNSCFRMRATVAEPVVSTAANSSYSITAGFRAAAPLASGDDVFFDGFERCSP
jgi:hypothetical protein